MSAARNRLYRKGDMFIGGENRINQEETTPFLQVHVKLFHMRPATFEPRP